MVYISLNEKDKQKLKQQAKEWKMSPNSTAGLIIENFLNKRKFTETNIWGHRVAERARKWW